MMRTYDIREEHRDGTFQDVQVGASSLPDARARVERDLLREGAARFDWRGHVVFVNCVPVEDRI